MSDKEFENTLQIARQLVGRLPGEMDDQLRKLIRRAKEDRDPAIGMDIIDLLTRHDNIRRWMNEQSELQNGPDRLKGGEYSPLAGGRSSIPASRKWKCLQTGCLQSLPVIQEDEDAPRCHVHGLVMVRSD